MLSFDYPGLQKIISGGQSGADQGGLVAGALAGLITGGHCPRDWKTNRGPNPLLEVLGVVCTLESDYPTRTHLNAKNSDATLIITMDVETAGTRCTLSGCARHDKPFYILLLNLEITEELVKSWEDRVVEFIRKNRVVTLNVAGNRDLADDTIIHDFTVMFLARVFSRLDDLDLLCRGAAHQ